MSNDITKLQTPADTFAAEGLVKIDNNEINITALDGETMCRRVVCPISLVSYPFGQEAVATAFQRGEPRALSRLTPAQKKEIHDHAVSYTERFMLTGNEDSSFIVSTSLFPASSLCVLLELDMSVSELWRALRDGLPQKKLDLAQSVELHTQRISSQLKESGKELAALIEELELCFNEIPRAAALGGRGADADEIERRCACLSRLIGCPVQLRIDRAEKYCETDLHLLIAFLMTVLMIARAHSPYRSVEISFTSSAKAAVAEARIGGVELDTLKGQIMEWDYIAAERMMSFWSCADGEDVIMRLHPYRYDWALNGIKDDIPRWIK